VADEPNGSTEPENPVPEPSGDKLDGDFVDPFLEYLQTNAAPASDDPETEELGELDAVADEVTEELADADERLAAVDEAELDEIDVAEIEAAEAGELDEELSDTDSELERQAAATRPVKRERTNAPVKKGAPTRKRDLKPEEEAGVGPVTFVKQSVDELKKTVWPDGDDVKQYFVVVLVFVLFMMVVVAGLDFVFGWGLLKWLG
jgi:preprotein translocase subunit SecE